MEFNVFEYFKDYRRTTNGPMTPEEQGTSLFLAGHMGERIRQRADVYAAKNRLSRRHFFRTASGFAAYGRVGRCRGRLPAVFLN
jgi:hypothetical protein